MQVSETIGRENGNKSCLDLLAQGKGFAVGGVSYSDMFYFKSMCPLRVHIIDNQSTI